MQKEVSSALKKNLYGEEGPVSRGRSFGNVSRAGAEDGEEDGEEDLDVVR